MWRAAGERKGEVTTLNNIASVYSQLGDQQTAFDYLHQALPIWRELGDRRGEAQTLNNIAHVHSVLGDYESAIDFEKQALALARAGHDRLAEGNILNNSGAALRRLGKSQAALELYEQALQMETEAGDRRLQGVTLSSIASAYQELGNPRKALDYYDRALALHRAATDRLWEGVTLTGMGAMYFSLGEQEKAFDHVTQAQAAFQAIGARSHEPRALYWMARIEAARGNLEGALERSAAAVDIVESLRSGVGRLDLQTSFFATAREQYELQIDILMRMHRSAQAVETFERARARGLLDLLGELNAGIRQGVAPALLDQERSLRELIDAKTGRQFKLLSGKHTEQQAVAAESETRSILAQYQELESRIRAESPRYAALTHPQPLSLAEIQKEALDGDTVLLEYALGGERSYLWAVTRDRIEAFTLPKRAEIESAAIGVYKEWSSNAPSGDLRQVASLSRMLLGPVRNLLAGKRLLIVDEGALQYVPFGALVGSAGRRMVMDHEIVNLPSASTLVALRRELSGRKQPPKMLAVLADPVYNPSDPRVKTAAPATRAGSPTGFERLRSTRHEAEDIFALWPAQSSLKALDFDASQTLATSGVLADYRVVHFASHGVLNTAHPELSGLVLSTVNEKGVPQEGFLRAHDVFNLKLSADLVVLSACQTALGTDIKGEGLVGLTRGFFYAGAARVMASLWMAPDGGSAELMKIFYQRMRTQHLQPAAALRSAQIAMLEDVRWREPYYWAAFTIQGLYP
jgi:CHAT domain-containing protein